MKGRRVILWNNDEVTVMDTAYHDGHFVALVRYDSGRYKMMPLSDARDAPMAPIEPVSALISRSKP